MNGGDVFGALTWGLRKYVWLVALAVFAIGVLVPFALSRSAPVYEAEAILAPNQQLAIPNVDVLPKFGESVFDSGAVADSVREAFGLTATTAVIPERVELVAEQDNVAFTIIGRSSDPVAAADLANIAASSFQLELNQTSDAVGYYIVLSKAQPPIAAEPQLAGGTTALLFGALGGLLVGLALVALLVVLRRPVLDPETAQEVTGAPALGRVTIPRGRGLVEERDAHGVARLCRHLLAGSASIILLVSPRGSVRLRHRLTPVLVTLLGRGRRVLASRGGEQDPTTQWGGLGAHRGGRKLRSGPGVRKSDLALVDGPTTDERISRPDYSLLLLVVPEGIGINALRKAADEYLDGGPVGVVLVRKRGLGHHRLGWGHPPGETAAPAAEPAGGLNGRSHVRDHEPFLPVGDQQPGGNQAAPAARPPSPEESPAESEQTTSEASTTGRRP